jgi:GT2 family glycosyltransferase
MSNTTAIVPCCNNELSIRQVLEAIRLQSLEVDTILVIDDASNDNSRAIAVDAGAKVIAVKKRSGRGAIRAIGVEQCDENIYMSCDATICLDESFFANAMKWLNEDESVAAVFGRLVDRHPRGLTGRWRARHLHKQHLEQRPSQYASLCTGAYAIRTDAIRKVGNFNSKLRHSEDVELGDRLLKAGYKVVFEPKCIAHPLVRNTIAQCLERHWRWYVARHGRMTLTDLCRWAGLAWRSMLVEDMRAKDPAAAVISLILPFHHWWRSQWEKANRKIHT